MFFEHFENAKRKRFPLFAYSCVPNKRAGPNKHAGWKKGQNKKNVQGQINVQGGKMLNLDNIVG